jgi:hypothetical protein
MGTILGRAVVEKAQKITQDTTGIRWPLDEMLGWLNSAQREIVLVRPDSNSATVKFQLVAGTKQTRPTGALRMLDVIRNMGTDGETPGRAIRLVEREILDSQIPDWHAATLANATVKHWVYDEREPTTWWCFPPQPTNGRGFVDSSVSKNPTNCTLKDVKDPETGVLGTVDTVISLDDIYENPLIDYQIFRAQSKETKYANSGKADAALQRFYTSLGVKTETDKRFTAKRSAPPHANPNVPGNSGALGD